MSKEVKFDSLRDEKKILRHEYQTTDRDKTIGFAYEKKNC